MLSAMYNAAASTAAAVAQPITRRWYSTPSKPISTNILWVSNAAPSLSRFLRGGMIRADKEIRSMLERFYLVKVFVLPFGQILSSMVYLMADWLSQRSYCVVWSPKQDGCYVHFLNTKEAQMAARTLNSVERKQHAYFVEGNPFVEDLIDKRPTKMIQIKMKGPALTDEDVFQQFRKYGKLRDLVMDEKNMIAKVVFDSQAAANAAMNCAHLKRVGETLLDLSYQPYSRWRIPWDLFSSPRALVPIAGVLVTSITLLLNPIRMYFVTQKFTIESRITGGLAEINDAVVAQLRRRSYVLSRTTPEEQELTKIINGKPSSVLLMIGPKGTDKSTLLRKVLGRRLFSVRIDCSKADTVQEFINLVVHSVGFRPSFTALNTIFSWFSGFVPAAVTPSVESQLGSVLHTIDRVLSIGTTATLPGVIAFDEFDHFLKLLESETKDEQRKAQVFLKLLSQWANETTKKGTAHVIFCSNSVYSEDALRRYDGFKSLPVFYLTNVTSGDATTYITEHVQEFSKNPQSKHFKHKFDDADVTRAVTVIGGRQGDLDHLLWLVENGSTLENSVQQMLDESKKLIRRRGFGLEMYKANTKAPWTSPHLWKTMKLLASADHIKYDQCLVGVFDGNEAALQGLIDSNLLSVAVVDGEKMLSAFSPLYLAAFREIMTKDRDFAIGMDKFCKNAEITKELTNIDALENELVKLGRFMYHEYKLGIDSDGVKTRVAQIDKELETAVASVAKKKQELAAIV